MHNDTCDLPGELITTADQFHVVIVRLNDMMNQQQSDTPTTRSNHASSPLNGTPTENSRFASAVRTYFLLSKQYVLLTSAVQIKSIINLQTNIIFD